jgi:hypothetical protein
MILVLNIKENKKKIEDPQHMDKLFYNCLNFNIKIKLLKIELMKISTP